MRAYGQGGRLRGRTDPAPPTCADRAGRIEQARQGKQNRANPTGGRIEQAQQGGPNRAGRYRCAAPARSAAGRGSAVMASRWARFVRGWLTAGLSVFVAAVSHVAGGGTAPGLLGVVLAMAFAGIVCVALAGKSLSRIRLSLSVVASQFAFHLLFGLGAGAGSVGAGSATAIATTTSHGSAHQHGATFLESAGSGAAMTSHNDSSMWAAHALAAVITVVVLRRGESAYWGLVELARAVWVAPLVPRHVSIATDSVDASRTGSAIADMSGLRDLGVLLVARPRRGPPPRLAIRS